MFSTQDIHCKILTWIDLRELCSSCKLVNKMWYKHSSNDACVDFLDFETCYEYFTNYYFGDRSKPIKKKSISHYLGYNANFQPLLLRQISMNGFGSHIKTLTQRYNDPAF